MSIKIFALLPVALSFCLTAHSQGMEKCKVEDNDCILGVANQVLHEGFAGNDAIGLPSLDPLGIEKMDIVQTGNSPAQIDLKLRNAELLGLSNQKAYKITGFKADPHNNVLEFHMRGPLMILRGPYDITGRLFFLPVYGKGYMTMNLINPDLHLKFLTKKVVRDGKSFMQIEKSKFSFDVTGANVNFENLFNGDKFLGDNMNRFMNSNWKLLLNELKQPINVSFGKLFQGVLQSVVNSTPYDEMFAKQ